MTRAQHKADRLRRVILIAGLIYCLAALTWLILPIYADDLFDEFMPSGLVGTPLVLMDASETEYGFGVVIFLAVMLLAQWAFLRPGKVLAARLAVEARPLRSAVVVAAAMATLLTVGIIALILEVPDWWETYTNRGKPWWRHGSIYGGMLAVWAAWTWVFFVYWRQGDRYTQLGRMIRGLVAGSILEALIAIPVHIWVARQRECYCLRGTYTALVFAGTVLLWAFGPGIILLYWREKYRRAKLYGLCGKCGYDLRGSSEICPECGTPIPRGLS